MSELGKFNKWEPKEEKTYTTWEVIKMLTENPKRKAKTDMYESDWIVIVGENGYILLGNNEHGYDTLFLTKQCLLAKWTIIEPEQVDFAEAFKAYREDKIIEACTGMRFAKKHDRYLTWDNVSNNEIDGKWIIL
jgi:hypothetical protein